MVAASLSISARDAPVAGPAAPSEAQPSTFQQLLSELNPLQYVPVVGTIYRAVTGDTIPETARFAGSLVVSGLTGGPIGLAVNLGITGQRRCDRSTGSGTGMVTSPAYGLWRQPQRRRRADTRHDIGGGRAEHARTGEGHDISGDPCPRCGVTSNIPARC